MKKHLIILISLVVTGGLMAQPGPGPGRGPGQGRGAGRGINFINDHDANNDGKVSKEEWEKHFQNIDRDKNGSLSYDELKDFMVARQKKRMEERDDYYRPRFFCFRRDISRYAKKRFARMDSNGDKQISPDEFNAVFDRMDSNADGFVTQEEFQFASEKPGSTK